MLILLLILSGSGINARSFFPATLEGTIPTEFSGFVDRYLTEMLTQYVPEGNAERRLAVDEVTLSFPLTENGTDRLREANGIYFSMEKGKRYSIVWVADSIELGRMSFPASYNLILGTGQVESFDNLLQKLLQTNLVATTPQTRPTSSPDSANIVRREGKEFYLGHLTNHKWINAIDAVPVWTGDFPAESISNLFCIDNMPHTEIALEMENYNHDRHSFVTSVTSLRYVLGSEEKCDIYFGVAKEVDEDGMLEAVAVFHNPALCYLHKLDMTIDTKSLFDTTPAPVPPIKAKLHPYIKLHNLNNLWGDKQSK